MSSRYERFEPRGLGGAAGSGAKPPPVAELVARPHLGASAEAPDAAGARGLALFSSPCALALAPGSAAAIARARESGDVPAQLEVVVSDAGNHVSGRRRCRRRLLEHRARARNTRLRSRVLALARRCYAC